MIRLLLALSRHLYDALVWGVVLYLAVCGACRLVHGAPVPPPPRFAADLLPGCWAYEYGPSDNGVICFNADGTYLACHEAPLGQMYVGTWTVESGVLVLNERRWCPALGTLSDPAYRYEYALSTAAYPTLAGRTAGGGTRVVLSKGVR